MKKYVVYFGRLGRLIVVNVLSENDISASATAMKYLYENHPNLAKQISIDDSTDGWRIDVDEVKGRAVPNWEVNGPGYVRLFPCT